MCKILTPMWSGINLLEYSRKWSAEGMTSFGNLVALKSLYIPHHHAFEYCKTWYLISMVNFLPGYFGISTNGRSTKCISDYKTYKTTPTTLHEFQFSKVVSAGTVGTKWK